MQNKIPEKKRIQVNVDKELAEQAEQVFNDIGLNTTVAITAFYKKVVATEGIPFDLTRSSTSERLSQAVQNKIDAGKSKKD